MVPYQVAKQVAGFSAPGLEAAGRGDRPAGGEAAMGEAEDAEAAAVGEAGPYRLVRKRTRCPAIIAVCRPWAVFFARQFRETRDLSATPQIT